MLDDRTEPRPPLTETPLRRLLAPTGGGGPRARLSVARAWGQFKRWSDRVDESWVGSVIGVVSLFALLWIMLFAAAVFG